jgi:hypothetical protein
MWSLTEFLAYAAILVLKKFWDFEVLWISN